MAPLSDLPVIVAAVLPSYILLEVVMFPVIARAVILAVVAALVLAIVSLVQVAAGEGMRLYHVIEIASCALAAFGLYLSFTGDAENWFE